MINQELEIRSQDSVYLNSNSCSNSDGNEKSENEHWEIRKSGSAARPGKVCSSAVCYRDDPKVNSGNHQCPETL